MEKGGHVGLEDGRAVDCDQCCRNMEEITGHCVFNPKPGETIKKAKHLTQSVINWNHGNINRQRRNGRSQGNKTLNDGKLLFHIFHIKESLQVMFFFHICSSTPQDPSAHFKVENWWRYSLTKESSDKFKTSHQHQDFLLVNPRFHQRKKKPHTAHQTWGGIDL